MHLISTKPPFERFTASNALFFRRSSVNTIFGPVTFTNKSGQVVSNAYIYKADLRQAFYRLGQDLGGVVQIELLPPEVQRDLGRRAFMEIRDPFFPAKPDDALSELQSLSVPGVPAAELQRMKAAAEKRWPGDYPRQRDDVKEQIRAYQALHQ